MKNLLLLTGILAAGALGAAEDPPVYMLGAPDPVWFCDTTEPATNAWAMSNACFFAHAASYAPTNGAAIVQKEDIAEAVRMFDEVAIGFPVERNKPQYYLGDALEAPADADWEATYELFRENPDRGAFLFDTKNRRVYVTLGVTSKFKWVVGTGEDAPRQTNETVVIATPVSSMRPKNIFWTDEGCGGKPVDLTGRFVSFFGPSNLVTEVWGWESTGTTVGDQESSRKVLKSGLHVEEQGGQKMLYAAGRLSGQVVMAYYDSAARDRIVDVIVVQVSEPTVDILSGSVGGELKPTGKGYAGDGLVAAPEKLEDEDDGRGAYLYQHQGQYAYSPKNKALFALRPTTNLTRVHTKTFWMETDNQGVQWPYEIDEYLVDWAQDIPVLVRGDAAGDPGLGVRIPNVYTAELQKYQDDGTPAVSSHANAPTDGYFTPTGAGRSLLKLTADDNVWFVPFRSVLRNDPGWYDLKAQRLFIGSEALCRGGTTMGVADGRTIELDAAIPAYVYRPASDPVWNANLYADGGTLANGLTSAVFAVSAPLSGGPSFLETWRSTSYRAADMPAALSVPAVPQVWRVEWPKAGDVPSIVIASQLGSDCRSIWNQGKALWLEGSNATVRLPSRSYFGPTGGVIAFWTRASEEREVEDSAILSLGNTNGTPLVSVDYRTADGGSFAVRLGSTDLNLSLTNGVVGTGFRPNEWVGVLVAWTKSLCLALAVGQESNASQFDIKLGDLTAELSDCLYDNALGAAPGRLTGSGRIVDQVTFCRSAFTNQNASVTELLYEKDGWRTNDPTLHLSFDDPDEIEPLGASARRLARDHVLGTEQMTENCLCEEPGAPRYGSGLVVSDVTPTIYRQNDPDGIGYNPNEEHGFVTGDREGYTVWALRCDLNGPGGVSPPGVLVEYAAGGKAQMRYYNVVLTNEDWTALAATCEAGRQIPGPHPFDLFADPWLKETHWDGDAVPPFRDRKGQVWARAAGVFDIRMFYAQQEGFDWAGLERHEVGDPIPWLSYLGENPSVPTPWRWTVVWPKPESVPTMKIGYTLTDAAYDLPEVWNATSMAVLYPEGKDAEDTVLLADPTVAQQVDLGFKASTQLAEIGLRTGPGEKLLERKGSYYFRDITPTLSDRLSIDPTTDRLVLVGKREEKSAGVNLVFPNVLTDDDIASVMAVVTVENDISAKLRAALESLRDLGIVRPTTVGTGLRNGRRECVDSYVAPDHYALTAMGRTNWVVLIENNATNRFCNEGNPINMHVLRVVPEYYAGDVVTREDPLNLLSQQLSVHYSQAFGGKAGDYVFEWQKASPSLMDWKDAFSNAVGRTSFAVGGQGDTLANMVNTFWRCRYRAVEGTPAYETMGEAWSAWSDKALAEGWVQRCLNNVTPYTQRMTDLYENPAETSVTMMRQAGAPYEGDVALNQDNLTSVGLIQLYRTILNKAESMSLLQGIDNADANQQLLLAVQRLSDLYTTLGDEAYADALNPTIGFGSNFGEVKPQLAIDYGAASSALFCFDNQVPTLLDEELALVRGRPCLNDPDGRTSPFFNRLVWNFTKGETAGEVAYAVNYGISGDRASTIDEYTAAEQYPQGHGDAFGHYLSALQGYYRLMRNPNFTWGVPGMGEMNVADSVVNVDYYDEATFAAAAAKVAKAARRATELTALKHWRDHGADTVGGGYVDANATNAFGYGEWASRGAYGALCNWAVANSLLPEAEAARPESAPYQDEGLTRIDRSTVPGIAELAANVRAIEETCDRMDAGLNPLGLDANAVPFDLTPLGDADDLTHFEQVRARAGKAFENAKRVLDRAQEYANRLKLVQEAETGVSDNLDETEDNVCAELIAIYGRPYSDDIGPAGTYPQGYYGPDRYHYMWMNLAEYGLTAVEDTLAVTTVTYKVDSYSADGKIKDFSLASTKETSGNALSYTLSANGVVLKPSDIRGERPASGELQLAYADFLSAYGAMQSARSLYKRARERHQNEQNLAYAHCKALASRNATVDDRLDADDDSVKQNVNHLARSKKALIAFETVADGAELGVSTLGGQLGIFGLSTSAPGDTVKSVAAGVCSLAWGISTAIADGIKGDIANCEKWIDRWNIVLQRADYDYASDQDTLSMWERVYEAADAEASAVADLEGAWRALAAAQGRITKLVQDARAIEEGLELTRQQYVNKIAKLRYNDMFFRKMRNAALAQYETAFAGAQKYALIAAKAYAYETGSPLEETEEGRAILRGIVGARALGETDAGGRPIVSEHGDTGLAGALAKLDANWDTLKTQLGINNPQPYATWFSLRHGLFRILADERGDAAWKKELSRHWVEDIRTDADFSRHCQPFASQFGLAEKEPGLVIPFATTIDFAYNFFGKPLAFDDSQFDSTWYATKVAKAGVWFRGYNEKRPGYTGQNAFAVTPNVYLVPVGTDLMRVPGTERNDRIASFDVVDQTVPVPYPITAAELAEASWLPSFFGETGGVDGESRIRRHPSFRAYFGARESEPTDAALDAVRLTGRSVWNTRWILVVPAGTLGSDREQALRAFIHGLDTNRDGVTDVLGVSDILIGFKTYSAGGK